MYQAQSHQGSEPYGLPGETKEAVRKFKEFSVHLRETLGREFSLEDHQAINRRLTVRVFLALGLLFGGLFGLSSVGVPQAPLYILGFVLFFRFHRDAMMVIHTTVHQHDTLGNQGLNAALDIITPILAPWSSEAFRPRHNLGHYEVVGIYADAINPKLEGVSSKHLGFFANPIQALRALFDEDLAHQRGLSLWRLRAQAVALALYFALAIAEVVYFGSAFILICHLLSGIAFAGTVVLIGALIHSSQVRNNTFESNGIYYAPDATGLFATSLGLLSQRLLGDMGVGHILHHAYPLASTQALEPQMNEWREYIRQTYPEVRYNRLFLHSVYKETLASFPEPTLIDKGFQVLAALLAAGVGCGMVLGVLPDRAYILGEHLILDYRIPLALIRGNPVAKKELQAFLSLLPPGDKQLERLKQRVA